MKKLLFLACLTLTVYTFSSCSKIDGNGPSVTKDFTLIGFNAVDNAIDADVFITQGADFKMEIQAQQNILDLIETPIVNNELTFRYKDHTFPGVHNQVTIHITMPDITGLSLSGSGSLNAQQPLTAANLDLDISGSGKINLLSLHANNTTASISGSGTMTVSGDSVSNESDAISGSGNLDFKNIRASFVTVSVSGSGNATVFASKTLDANISGSGNVKYSGSPNISSKISGSGFLSHL